MNKKELDRLSKLLDDMERWIKVLRRCIERARLKK